MHMHFIQINDWMLQIEYWLLLTPEKTVILTYNKWFLNVKPMKMCYRVICVMCNVNVLSQKSLKTREKKSGALLKL